MGVYPAAHESEAPKGRTAEFPPAVVAGDQPEHAVAELSTFQMARVREGLNKAIQPALTGTKTPEEALSEAQARPQRTVSSQPNAEAVPALGFLAPVSTTGRLMIEQYALRRRRRTLHKWLTLSPAFIMLSAIASTPSS